MPTVACIGSLNVDLVVRVARMPGTGETVMGHALERHLGGKGLNQALAAARAGGHVALVGAVGTDDGGAWMRAELGAEEVRALARGEDDARGERVHGDGRDDARLGARGEEEVGEVLVEGGGLALVRPELGEEVRVERARRGEEGVELVGLVEVVRRRVLRACGARGARSGPRSARDGASSRRAREPR